MKKNFQGAEKCWVINDIEMEIVYKTLLKQNKRKSNKQNKYKTHLYAHTHIKENDTETYEQIPNLIHIKNYTNTYNIFYPDCQKQNI